MFKNVVAQTSTLILNPCNLEFCNCRASFVVLLLIAYFPLSDQILLHRPNFASADFSFIKNTRVGNRWENVATTRCSGNWVRSR